MSSDRKEAPTRRGAISRVDAIDDEFARSLARSHPKVGERYRLTRMLGSGGMGDLFVAENLTIEMQVAVKTLKPELLADGEFRSRFQGEARAIAAIRHHCVARFLDLVVGDPTFLVMEYVDGPSLMQVLKAGHIVLYMHKHTNSVPLHKREPAIAPALSDLVQCALAKKPERRPQTMADFVQALDAIAGGDARTPPRMRPGFVLPTTRRRRWLVPLALVVGMAAASGAGWTLAHHASRVVAPPKQLLLVTDPPGARALVDGEAMGRTPLAVDVPVGSHDVHLVHPGRDTVERTKRGAFTGAVEKRAGVFAEADGGMLFLDEIGELPLELQPKLLRVLENGQIRPVGSAKPKSVDVRIIAATNRDLKLEVNRGRFREDLYYRLNVVTLRVPPLRERREDIPLLADHFWRQLAGEGARLPPNLLDAFAAHDWPGNVRELRNVVERALLLKSEAAVDAVGDVEVFRDAKARAIAGFERAFLTDLMARARQHVAHEGRGHRICRIGHIRPVVGAGAGDDSRRSTAGSGCRTARSTPPSSTTPTRTPTSTIRRTAGRGWRRRGSSASAFRRGSACTARGISPGITRAGITDIARGPMADMASDMARHIAGDIAGTADIAVTDIVVMDSARTADITACTADIVRASDVPRISGAATADSTVAVDSTAAADSTAAVDSTAAAAAERYEA